MELATNKVNAAQNKRLCREIEHYSMDIDHEVCAAERDSKQRDYCYWLLHATKLTTRFTRRQNRSTRGAEHEHRIGRKVYAAEQSVGAVDASTTM